MIKKHIHNILLNFHLKIVFCIIIFSGAAVAGYSLPQDPPTGSTFSLTLFQCGFLSSSFSPIYEPVNSQLSWPLGTPGFTLNSDGTITIINDGTYSLNAHTLLNRNFEIKKNNEPMEGSISKEDLSIIFEASAGDQISLHVDLSDDSLVYLIRQLEPYIDFKSNQPFMKLEYLPLTCATFLTAGITLDIPLFASLSLLIAGISVALISPAELIEWMDSPIAFISILRVF